jgi:hypothetical protein
MSCFRFGLRKKFVPYLEGELPPREAKRVEKHLLDCGRCRAIFGRLRAGHRSAQQLRHLSPDGAHPAPEFETMMADVGEIVPVRHKWVRAWEDWFYALTTPRLVQVLMVLVLALTAVLVVSNRRYLFGDRNSGLDKSTALKFSEFHPLSIPELQSNTRPHIAIEGYVRDVHIDQEEGTLHFTLAEIPQGLGPFVICEIMSPIGMPIPRDGNRVRVYGVARYDAQPGREWYEVNPVLNIAVLKR